MVDEQPVLLVLAGVGEVQAEQRQVRALAAELGVRRDPHDVAAEGDHDVLDGGVAADHQAVRGRRAPSPRPSPGWTPGSGGRRRSTTDLDGLGQRRADRRGRPPRPPRSARGRAPAGATAVGAGARHALDPDAGRGRRDRAARDRHDRRLGRTRTTPRAAVRSAGPPDGAEPRVVPADDLDGRPRAAFTTVTWTPPAARPSPVASNSGASRGSGLNRHSSSRPVGTGKSASVERGAPLGARGLRDHAVAVRAVGDGTAVVGGQARGGAGRLGGHRVLCSLARVCGAVGRRRVSRPLLPSAARSAG